MKKTSSVLLAALLLGAGSASAFEIREIKNAAGQVVFEARFFDVGDGPYVEDDGEVDESVWPWEPHIIDRIVDGMAYWAEVIQPVGDGGPAIVNIGTDDEEGNAFGYSPRDSRDGIARTLLQRQLQGLPVDPADMTEGAHGVFGLGPSDFPQEYRYSQIPLSGKDDIVSTAIHEIAHGLGFSSGIVDEGDEDDGYVLRFGEALGGWDSLMVDDHGRHARPGQAVLCSGCNNADDPDAFDARRNRTMLVGANIRDALEGGLPGVPISMYARDVDGNVFVDDNNMSHIELRNSMMSHQNYRNYTSFMEAELAVLQDLGYSIDRRNFFGRSVYGSGVDIVNDRGFFARNAAGTQYLPGQYNRAMLGLGLHVYGGDNHIRQTADLLSAGEGGAGIRVDGENNTVVIDPGVRVYANGVGGQGVMFTYGRHHNLVQRGDVEALGAHGVALRFDFGDNALTNEIESRGSYIHTADGRPVDLLPELEGSLADQVDITGRVAGREAAIHISGNAHVGAINVMQGAVLQGDIVSDYAEVDEAGRPRLTTVSFGQRADGEGLATGQADAGFQLAYAGNIRGEDNLVLSFDGGRTHLSGQHVLQGATVQADAMLSGTAAFTVAPGSTFVNHGTLSPGNSIGRIAIDGNFRQSESGRLQAEFDAGGAHDVLAVSGTADLAGSLALTPMAGWYQSGWTAQTGDVVAAGTVLGSFDSVSVASVSPTLDFQASGLGGQRYELVANRADDAYSRHGNNGNERSAGQALQRLAADAPADAGDFFQALDFSAPDGSDVSRTLGQVSPQGYSALLAASLMRERDVMDTALRGQAEGVRQAGTQWRGFATVFGGEGRQDSRGSTVDYRANTYGLVVGGARRLASQPDVAVGLHLDIADQSVKVSPSQWGKGDTTSFGVGALLSYRPESLAGAHAEGGVRFGIEQGEMKRSVAVGNYRASHKADWTGHTASVQAGGGYRWQLGSALSVGPVASLNYARVSRPSVSESGPSATRLSLESRHADALRSSLGVGAVAPVALDDGSTLKAQVSVSWEHEWLDRDVTQAARFSSGQGASFKAVNAVLPRDSMSLRAGLAWHRGESFSVGADLGGRVGGGYQSVDGQVSMRWAF